ncbi:hypothetical protein [Henriciella mobilis]|uniref:Uncharacterized protein n=1 Tax=Henriciella mobilis TaxID=2305467 RepID=A0A399RA60_9PROT|nr:hypothetical protein [Henriciella mobilis]RIJ28456.1 hypothetical protein D1223_13815 [Henriciella mobilis]
MDDIAGLAASAAGGGLFGLIGTALGRVAGFFEARQAQAHERARWAHETELLERQQAARAAETEAELALAETAGRWEGLRASVEADAAIAASYRWVDAVRGLTRPLLTLLLWLIAGGIWLGADDGARASITETATFAATAATLWWFGDRSPRQGRAP